MKEEKEKSEKNSKEGKAFLDQNKTKFRCPLHYCEKCNENKNLKIVKYFIELVFLKTNNFLLNSGKFNCFFYLFDLEMIFFKKNRPPKIDQK